MNRRLLLKEDDEASIIIDAEEIPSEDVLAVSEPEIEEKPADDNLIVNAYSGMLQDLLRKQWDVINAAESINATLSTEEGFEKKEDAIAILNKLIEDTTVTIGMVTKALGIVDPSQEELMDKGVEQAEEVISEEPKVEEALDEPKKDLDALKKERDELWAKMPDCTDAEIQRLIDIRKEIGNAFYDESLKESITDEVTFDDVDPWDVYWAENALWEIENMLDNSDEDDEEMFILSKLPSDKIKEICLRVSDVCRNSDYLWEVASELIRDTIREEAIKHVDSIETSEVDINKGE